MDRAVNAAVVVKAKELARLASGVTGQEYPASMLSVEGSIWFDHRDFMVQWRACLGPFCSSEKCRTLEEALAGIELAILRWKK